MKNIVIYLVLLLQMQIASAQPQKTENISRIMMNDMKKDEILSDNITMLKKNNLNVDISKGEVLKISEKLYEVKFDIVDNKNAFDYKNMYYIFDNGNTFVFFDNKNPKYSSQTPTNTLRWTDWRDTGWPLECHSRFLCFSNNRQGKYHWEFRQKIVNGYIKKVEYRLVFNYCGC